MTKQSDHSMTVIYILGINSCLRGKDSYLPTKTNTTFISDKFHSRSPICVLFFNQLRIVSIFIIFDGNYIHSFY